MNTAEKEYGVHMDVEVNKICVNKSDVFTTAVTSALSSIKQVYIVLQPKQGPAQCLVCSSTTDTKHSVAIFSTDSSIPNCLSSVLDLLVVTGDGLSQYICRLGGHKLMHKLTAHPI